MFLWNIMAEKKLINNISRETLDYFVDYLEDNAEIVYKSKRGHRDPFPEDYTDVYHFNGSSLVVEHGSQYSQLEISCGGKNTKKNLDKLISLLEDKTKSEAKEEILIKDTKIKK